MRQEHVYQSSHNGDHNRGMNAISLRMAGGAASAMASYIKVMHQQAAGDATLLGAIGDLGQDIQRMKADGTAAMDAGKVLADRARTIAQSIGVKLD